MVTDASRIERAESSADGTEEPSRRGIPQVIRINLPVRRTLFNGTRAPGPNKLHIGKVVLSGIGIIWPILLLNRNSVRRGTMVAGVRRVTSNSSISSVGIDEAIQ